jgi:hypothetical protein
VCALIPVVWCAWMRALLCVLYCRLRMMASVYGGAFAEPRRHDGVHVSPTATEHAVRNARLTPPRCCGVGQRDAGSIQLSCGQKRGRHFAVERWQLAAATAACRPRETRLCSTHDVAGALLQRCTAATSGAMLVLLVEGMPS